MGTILLSYILYVYVILVWSFVPGEYSHVLADYPVEGYSEIMKWVMGQQIYYYTRAAYCSLLQGSVLLILVGSSLNLMSSLTASDTQLAL